ncbi:NAD(P)-binding protein [Rhodovastum atsumiense]|uniref:NAD(P)-binding protein n=1 Tax=Rhodovastum atsumiense TaxID=504468 RepID=A0A5M6IVK9_9PROT|nr:FAD-dependent oxidoreductase [Rhodovastum atsumiense]KAA5611455.1 NAD(P)-binding protein [Rhodovastum atsumiense]CAH2601139.1 NAD(P)-binding protein [Rhodovastum atsumiense]
MSCKPFSLDLAADQSGLPHYQPPPCQVACPIGTDVASYVGLIWAGDLSGALEAITATNPFSGVCGRVCDAPCEPACRRTGADGPVAIRALKRYVMDRLGPGFHLPAIAPDKTQRVAIIGAGPAGLTAAQDIAAAGYHVDVYEALSRPGGMMLWGIPDFRLPPEVVEQDIARILQRCPGITLHLSAPLGEAVSLADLSRSHDAVLLTVGASAGRRLGVPGDDLPMVQDGVSFLNAVNGGARPRLPAHVVVVGGGDVAMDACRTARRLPGVEKVTVLYRRGPDEIPARAHEISAALAEGIEIVYNVAPAAVLARPDGSTRLRCLRTELGAPGPDGRRAFRTLPDSGFELPAGLVIAAVGQKTATLELARHGLLEGERIATDPATMRTRLPGVFAAGDAAFGSSTIVQAMFQGHKAAYYVLAALEGEAHPLPYRTPCRTRAVPVAQDPRWEILGLEHPRFLGLGDALWGETEAGYDDRVAREQAARCYRCDTETGSVDYSVKMRETIFALARQDATPSTIADLTRQRLAGRPDPFLPTRPATFDELVFLPANLTRLVIDPYREACRTRTPLGNGLDLAHPMLVGGFDAAPEAIRAAVAAALLRSGGGYAGRRPLDEPRIPWLQLVTAPDAADARAAAVLLVKDAHAPFALPQRRHPGQLLGLVATAETIAEAVDFAITAKADLLLLDGSGHMQANWAELAGPPDLGLITGAVSLLRARKAEETIPLLWFGGLRSGTDLAKTLALGCNAGITSLAAALALGGEIGEAGPDFAPADHDSRVQALASFLQAAVSECSMMARCTGKTDVHNLEPEDLRTISLAARRATGITMAGTKG